MKSAEVVLFLALVAFSACHAIHIGNNLTNGTGNAASEVVVNDKTVTDDPLEDPTTVPGDISTEEPKESCSNETETAVQPVTLTPSITETVTSIVNQNETTAPSANKTSTHTGDKKRLSTEVTKSKCESLGLELPNAGDCKCYKQRSYGTDLPHGFCYYYECAGDPPALSAHKCEFS